MRKRSIIDLTPLLDVILLLIFAFLINMQGQSDEMTDKYDKLESKYEAVEEVNKELSEENAELKFKNSSLEKENQELMDDLKALTAQMDYEKTANIEEKETIEDAIIALSNIVGMEESELKKLLNENPDAQNAMEKILDSDDVVLEMYKYNFVMNKFFFIDVELVGKDNRVVINSENTQIAIDISDNQSSETKSAKSLEIYDELKELIDSRQGGAEMVTVTLIVRDPEVYQYAYEIAWDALRELELRASGYRLYKTSYTYTK